MTITVRAPLPSGLPPKKWGSPDIFANVAVLAIAIAAPVFPHQNLDSAPPARVRQLAEFIAPNLAVRTGAIPPARNIYDLPAPKRWQEQFSFPSMAVLPTATPLLPARFDLPQRRILVPDPIPPNLAVLSALVAQPPPTGFRDFVGLPLKKWTESIPFSSSRMPTAAPIIPNIFDGWSRPRFALDNLNQNLSILIPAVSPAPPPQFDASPPRRLGKVADWTAGSTAYISAAPIICAAFDSVVPRRLPADIIAPNLVALYGVVPIAPPIAFEYGSVPRLKWTDSQLPPNVAVYATITVPAPVPYIDYSGLPRKRLLESQPFGSTFMPTIAPQNTFEYGGLPSRKWIESHSAPNVAVYATNAVAAPQPFIDYLGLPRKRWSESQPSGSTFMPTAAPIRPFQFETSLPVKRRVYPSDAIENLAIYIAHPIGITAWVTPFVLKTTDGGFTALAAADATLTAVSATDATFAQLASRKTFKLT